MQVYDDTSFAFLNRAFSEKSKTKNYCIHVSNQLVEYGGD